MIKHKKMSHKGENGRVLIIGGSKNYVGCLVLAGIACLRTGVDLVTIACPEKVAWSINKYSPDLITAKLKGDYINSSNYKTIMNLIAKNDVILLGNGLGVKSKQVIKKIVLNCNKPMVIDADGVKSISLSDVSDAILTPHEKELEILLDNSKLGKFNLIKNKFDKIKSIKKYLNAKKSSNIILLKGRSDYIISANKLMINKTGNERMTVGGTGDILAGVCAGYLAQTKNLFKSALLAAKNTGNIGDFLYKKYKYNYIASDLLSLIKEVKAKKR